MFYPFLLQIFDILTHGVPLHSLTPCVIERVITFTNLCVCVRACLCVLVNKHFLRNDRLHSRILPFEELSKLYFVSNRPYNISSSAVVPIFDSEQITLNKFYNNWNMIASGSSCLWLQGVNTVTRSLCANV